MILWLWTLTGSTAYGQYFGGNKVQYKTFHFQVLKTSHFDVYFYPDERDAASQAARMAERWYARLSRILQHELSGRQPLVLYASHADFEQTNIIEGTPGEGTGGVTEMFKRRIVLPLAGTMADTDHVIGHELVHAFQYDIGSRAADSEDGGSGGIEPLPLWFIEGMAEYLSVGPVDAHTAMWIRDAIGKEKLPTIRQLDDPRYFPYRWGQALWAYVAGRWGDRIVGRVLDAAIREGEVEAAFRGVLEIDTDQLSREWHAAIHTAYFPVTTHTRPASDYARRLTATSRREDELNVSPSLSPDGRRLVYFSQRDLLSIDMVLADADSGRVIRSMVRTSLDPHFSSLQFINSAGSWYPDGRRFVFGAVRGGRPELVIYDVDRRRVDKEIAFPTLGEILTPSVSPDSRRVAFSATAGGFSDLYVYDLETASLHRVTSDAFADLQPAWSPDGRSIAFVTERFGGDPRLLRPGGFTLAVLDVSSGAIRPVETFPAGKSINPAWSADGRSLYFLSDTSGITNLYAVDLANKAVRPLTNLRSGISGITPLSPALAVATRAARLAFSTYENGAHQLYVSDAIGRPGDPPMAAPPFRVSPAVLPPADRKPGELERLLSDAELGLPEGEGRVAPYQPRLSLDYVGQPFISAGLDPFGAFVGGGLSFVWSDMLGNHTLATAVQTDTSFGGLSDIAKNTAGVVSYTNRTHRWNWGAGVQQVPYLSGSLSSGVGLVNGRPARVDKMVVVRQTSRGVTGVTAYPFDRARRIEFTGGYQRISFDEQVQTRATSPFTGEVLFDRTTTTALAQTLSLGSVGAAAVFDNSIHGATSPVAGQRYRFELTPTAGTIAFTGVLADYRRYLAPVPFYTIATRVLHYGRYGGGAEDDRLPPLFVGYPQLVRGYDIGSFDAGECAGALASCPAFDRLLGSRLLVGNAELRFPLLRPLGVRRGMYGPIPIEVAFFGDAGVAWTADREPTFLGGDRKPVASVGVTLRANLFGFAIGQLDLARPLQRPGKGWMWAFNLTPGF